MLQAVRKVIAESGYRGLWKGKSFLNRVGEIKIIERKHALVGIPRFFHGE